MWVSHNSIIHFMPSAIICGTVVITDYNMLQAIDLTVYCGYFSFNKSDI